MSEKNIRPPIITVMGHVDHGKTSILDKIRLTEVQKHEAGGITQSIGAYQVEHKGKLITFIDTPGHEAFAKMRARGGQVADIVVLVVAGNEGVKPQTEESISHAKASGAKIIVALNKMDLEQANPGKVKKQLSDHGIQILEYGGDVPLIETSAVTGQGLDELLETILKVAEDLRLTADPDSPVKGLIIESRLDQRQGPSASGIVLSGILHPRDVIVAQDAYARIKSLKDWRGNEVKEAGPATPVKILGFNEVPPIGVEFISAKSVKAAQEHVTRSGTVSGPKVITARDRLQHLLTQNKVKELPAVIKADSNGSLEAVISSVKALETKEVKIKILHQGVGQINENDVFLAMPVGAILLGFNVDIDKNAELLAKKEKLIYRTYQIIYHLIEELQEVIAGEVENLTQKILGEARVKQVFELTNGSLVAGCEVVKGLIQVKNKVRVLRGKEQIGEARVVSLKKLKEDVKEVKIGQECGINVTPEIKFQGGDVIQSVSE